MTFIPVLTDNQAFVEKGTFTLRGREALKRELQHAREVADLLSVQGPPDLRIPRLRSFQARRRR